MLPLKPPHDDNGLDIEGEWVLEIEVGFKEQEEQVVFSVLEVEVECKEKEENRSF